MSKGHEGAWGRGWWGVGGAQPLWKNSPQRGGGVDHASPYCLGKSKITLDSWRVIARTIGRTPKIILTNIL